MAVNDTPKNGKHYQRTSDGLQLIHLETDDAQVLVTEGFETSQQSQIAVGDNLSEALVTLNEDTTTSLDQLLTNVNKKQDKLTAGTNIQINDSTISATDTTYTLSADAVNAKITLTPSNGTAQSITVPYATKAGSANTATSAGTAASAGSASTATRANQDGDGNVISTTYAKSASLATVATSGSYNDLTNKPTIPTVNNGTLTMQVAGVNKATFSANQSGASTFNVTASDLGLSSAMKFGGVAKQSLTEGGTQNADATSGSYTTSNQPSNGTVYLDKDKHLEYVWVEGSTSALGKWELLGQDGSYALSSVTITGTGALDGGGNLTANRTITHNAGNAASKSLGLYKISTDAYSHVNSVTAVTKSDITSLGIPSADTHYTTHLYVGATDTASSAATTNGNTYIKLYDDSSKRAEFQIKGAGGTNVSSDASGNITITSSSYDLPTASSTTIGGIKLGSDTVQTVAASAVTATASRTYATQLNSSGQLVVNVPWTDTTTAKKLDHSVNFTITGSEVSGAGSSTLDGSTVTIATSLVDNSITDNRLTTPTYSTTDSVYSAVAVNSKGRVTKGAQSILYTTTAPTTAPTNLVEGGTLIYIY